MKRIIYIFALILSSLFTIGIDDTQAQVKEDFKRGYMNIDKDCSVFINLTNANIDPKYKKYVTGLSDVQRLNKKEYLLKPLKNREKQIRVVADKGYLCPLERELNEPVSTKYWSIKNLDKNEETITVSLFCHSTNQLIGKITYDLIPIYEFKPRIVYVDTNGNECEYEGGEHLSKLPIDWGKPMKTIVKYGEQTFVPLVHTEVTLGFKGDEAVAQSTVVKGDKITGAFISELKALSIGYSRYISNIKIRGNDGIVRTLPPVEMKK